jgi:hypothetical protein
MSQPFPTRILLIAAALSASQASTFATNNLSLLARIQDAAASSPGQPSASPAPAPESKKPKKVWTNDDLGSTASSASSAEGEKKPAAKPILAKSVNAQFAANVRKQIDKLQRQLADIDVQLADLKRFKDGESTGGTMQLHKHYNMNPIDQQITDLQEKKKRIQAQVDALLDDVRKKGIEPGQLR